MNLIGFISQFSNLILKSKVRVFKIFGELLISPPRCWNNCDFNQERIKGIKREDKDGEEALICVRIKISQKETNTNEGLLIYQVI